MGTYEWNSVGRYSGPIKLGEDMGVHVDVEFYRGGINKTYGWAHDKKGHDAPINPANFGRLNITDQNIVAMIQNIVQVRAKVEATPDQITKNNPDLVAIVRNQLK